MSTSGSFHSLVIERDLVGAVRWCGAGSDREAGTRARPGVRR
jgi:hypothetical protein